jgi:hypothetical protein
MPRQPIIELLETTLRSISVASGYQTDFNGVLLWQEVPTEYGQNAIYVKDVVEKYDKHGNKYTAVLKVEIVAVVIETATDPAAKLGNLALADLIQAVSSISYPGAFFILKDASKWIETQGKTACQVELNIDVKYQF